MSDTSEKPRRIRILITVKTYPLPSVTYKELVCTAGILQDGTWIRLYPVAFRSMPFSKWYRKYDWLEIDVVRNEKDFRIESYRPVSEPRKVGSIDTKNGWAERKKFVLKNVAQSVEQLVDLSKTDHTSLGTIKVREIVDFVIEDDEKEWKGKWMQLFQQRSLFGDNQKPLDKIPYKISYKFKCMSENCKGHKMQVRDWELFQLYRNCLQRADGDIDTAKQKVIDKYLTLFSQKDLYFFLGTGLVHQRRKSKNPFMIIGVFWPPKSDKTQATLF